MKCTPRNKSPVGAMPKAAYQEDYQRITNDFGFSGATAAQRNVEIIAEPRGERDVPAPPELSNVATEIGIVEVAHQPNAKQLGHTDGDIGIAREVGVDLEGEEHGRQRQSGTVVGRLVPEDLVHKNGAVVGDGHFLEQSPQHLPQAVHRLVVAERAGFAKLR